ncbi:hypothetical protein BV25DRAFT_166890 [Artomyces pyxidatus]|uniref:Uncharacterized protein n=1 Tax=Artomyces pyxidatus TaxID=48021 RepID=A0ACB8SH32_9AGAM|nr:hypothetical protein BV25DRAFT_166890 [Artomyces pyxidatus]
MFDTSSILRPVLAAASPVNSDRIARKRRVTEYPKEVWYSIGCFIFLVMVSNIMTILSGLGKRRRVIRQDAEGHLPRQSRALPLRRLPLALVNAWRVVAFRSVIDLGRGYSINVAELFLTATYIVILLTWTLINTTDLEGHKFDISYWSSRAGDIAAVQMPLIVALGMRNNIIAFITGISFEKLNYLHRMCARTVCVLLWLHAGGKIKSGIAVELSENYIRAAITAIVAFSVLLLVSIRPARQLGYEFFVIAHFCLILIMLVGAYFHTKHFEVDYYIWPSFVLWGFDRAIRIIRLVIFNHSYLGFSTGLGTFNATADVVASGFVRIRFRRPNHLHWSPGQSAFLTMPEVSTIPFESHPFTIANADLDHLQHDEAADFTEKESNSSGQIVPASHGKDLVFIVKAREGFTKRLNKIAKTDGTLKIFVDGPYGAPPNLSTFDTVVFFAGGSGVTFTNPLFVDLLHRARVQAAAARNIIFVWSIRDLDHVNLVYQDLLDSLWQELPGINIDVRIHVTSTGVESLRASPEGSKESVGSPSKASDDTDKIVQLPRTRLEYCRPNVQAIIEEAASLAMGDMTVNVCGPAGLSADVRKALRSSAAGPMSVLRGGPSISLFVEAFGYA